MIERVFITGVGAISPTGNSAESSWKAVIEGQSGIAALRDIDVDRMSVTIGGQVKNFDSRNFLSHIDARRVDPYVWYGVAAALEAMTQALVGLERRIFKPQRFSILAATGYAATTSIYDATRALDTRGPRAVSPNVTIYGAADALSSYLSIVYGAMGASHGLSAACASGTVGLGEGMRTIRHGYADAVLVVGADDSLNRQDIASTANLRALASNNNDDPVKASRPFDRARSGFVMSSGAEIGRAHV